MSVPESVLARIEAALGPKGATRDPAAIAPHIVEWRDRYRGATPLLAMPATALEAAAVVRICAETGTGLVPQGGNTGAVGGQIPFGQILLSLSRMNRIRALDAANNTITAEAGCVLADVQRAAENADRLYPLSLASEGSAEIGGLLSTNAGGVNVLRYGCAREHVLGLEVVLPTGEIWDGLRRLRKDNTGYDLKQLFLGAEGTLGIITAAVLKLWPRPRAHATAFAAVPELEHLVPLLHHIQGATGGAVSAFELVPRIGLEFVLRHVPGARDPLPAPHPWYALIEIESGSPAPLEPALGAALSGAPGIADAAIAANGRQRAEFWLLRERLSEAQKPEGGSIKHDVSVPLSEIATFISRATEAVTRACPGVRPVPFGHAGDGNVHFNLSQPMGADKAAFLARWEELSRIVHDIAAEMGGSISAEHGLGLMKRDEILRYKSQTEIALMRTLKSALDPLGLMNPGKLLAPPH